MKRRLRPCGLLEPGEHKIKEIRATMKYDKEKLNYLHDHRCIEELSPLKPEDVVWVKRETGSREWKAATVVRQHASPRSYIVNVRGRRIRRNKVALRTDSTKSHVGYQKSSCKHRGGKERSWETTGSAACSSTTHARHTYGESTNRPVSREGKPSKRDTAFTWSSSN